MSSWARPPVAFGCFENRPCPHLRLPCLPRDRLRHASSSWGWWRNCRSCPGRCDDGCRRLREQDRTAATPRRLAPRTGDHRKLVAPRRRRRPAVPAPGGLPRGKPPSSPHHLRQHGGGGRNGPGPEGRPTVSGALTVCTYCPAPAGAPPGGRTGPAKHSCSLRRRFVFGQASVAAPGRCLMSGVISAWAVERATRCR